MAIWLVSRHQATIEWLRRKGFTVDKAVTHLDPEAIEAGDKVVGILPTHIAARVCARNGRYFHLALDLPPEVRGRELTLDDLNAFGARIEEYHVEPAEVNQGGPF
jgi:CRISPR-associated protein Csx16